MASRRIEVSLVVVLMTVLLGRGMAQSGCTNVLIGMVSCLNYVTGSSSTPSSSCCSSLANVVKSQPQCLCTALNGGAAALGISINNTLALELPGACKVKTPPVSLCDAANAPGTSPVGSPDSSPTSTSIAAVNGPGISPAGSPDSTSITESKTSADNGSTSDGTSIKMRSQLVAIFVIMASCASTFSSF